MFKAHGLTSDNNRIEGKGHRRYQGRDTENNFFSKK